MSFQEEAAVEIAKALSAKKDQAACDALVDALNEALSKKQPRNIDVLVSLCGMLAAEIVSVEGLGACDTETFAQGVWVYLMSCVETGEKLKRLH